MKSLILLRNSSLPKNKRNMRTTVCDFYANKFLAAQLGTASHLQGKYDLSLFFSLSRCDIPAAAILGGTGDGIALTYSTGNIEHRREPSSRF